LTSLKITFHSESQKSANDMDVGWATLAALCRLSF